MARKEEDFPILPEGTRWENQSKKSVALVHPLAGETSPLLRRRYHTRDTWRTFADTVRAQVTAHAEARARRLASRE